jgi:Sir2 family
MSLKKRHQPSATPIESKRKRTEALQDPPFNLYADPSSPSATEGIDSVIRLLQGKKNIAVLLGAGISVACGIPDFRTKGSGLYSILDTQVRVM